MLSKVRMTAFGTALCAALAFALCIRVVAANIEKEFGESEVRLGKEAAAEIAKEYKLSDNAADLQHLRSIGAKITEAANEQQVKALYGSAKITPFEYTFDIIEEDDVNALSLPGGRIYVYRGLLDFVQSDHELAGVLAHEAVHAAHHHMVYLLKRQASLNNLTAVWLLAALMGASPSDVGNIQLGVQLFQIARLNGYGMQAERDADNGAVTYTRRAGFNPVGLLTFLERLGRQPQLIEYGIYRSHPLDADRIVATRTLIEEMGLPINRRATTNAIKAEVKIEGPADGQTASVVLNGRLILRPAPAGSKTAEERARQVADRINAALDAGLKMYQIKLDLEAGAVVGRNEVLVEFSDADAKLMNSTPSQAAESAAAAIREVVWRQMVDTVH